MLNRGKARAYANIALIKYWGKRDDQLVLPMNSSLSLTLDSLYTETEVVFDEKVDRDYFYLDGKIQDMESTNRVNRFLDLFRDAAGINRFAIIRSINYVPTGAGLASSASGFAALAAAANVASGLNLDHRELSIYARQGSGSATRSIYGGFVEWKKGTNEEDSYAVPIDDGKWDIGMVIVIVNSRKKNISSREGMKQTLLTSPFYNNWVESAEEDLKRIKIAIENRDIKLIGKIAEANSFKMHATMLGADPPLLYWEPETIRVMEIVYELREEGTPCYFTMDAGPNVKILCRLSDAQRIRRRLEQGFKSKHIIVAGSGPGITVL
ncbi:MAG TPA: diphosphomevalonate decarboxylase [Tepidimicrobium sp.]|nr:diphosphomevalonate decarboxylase [Tepidimicrobium sp.]